MSKALLISCLILIFGCNKEINSGSVNAVSADEMQNASSATSNTYLPLTKGTYWKYSVKTDDETPETSTLTVLGIQKKINSKNYQEVKSVKGDDKDTLYYAQDKHNYYLYTNTGMSAGDKIKLEILFLKDDEPVKTTWVLPAGTADGFSLRCFGKVVERNMTLTVGDKTYHDVIHTYIEIRKPLLFTYVVVTKQDFYTAKGIGVVKNISNVVLPENSVTKTNISGYQIK